MRDPHELSRTKVSSTLLPSLLVIKQKQRKQERKHLCLCAGSILPDCRLPGPTSARAGQQQRWDWGWGRTILCPHSSCGPRGGGQGHQEGHPPTHAHPTSHCRLPCTTFHTIPNTARTPLALSFGFTVLLQRLPGRMVVRSPFAASMLFICFCT